MTFDRSVFINCPFDEEYKPLLDALLFSIIFLGFQPRIALERVDSSESRVDKIYSLIRESAFGIHDLSRLQSTKKGEIFRLNMPFELGLDIGCKIFGEERFSHKKCLILEKERFRYQAALSDLSGSDIKVHKNSAPVLVREVRNWLCNVVEMPNPPSGSVIWLRYADYTAWLFDKLNPQGYSQDDLDALPINEVTSYMSEWARINI